MSLDELYQEVILDHFKHPRCKGCLAQADSNFTLYNPLCGDQVELALKLRDGKIEDIAHSGHGCSISQAAASMMSDLCKGKTVTEVKNLCQIFRLLMRGEKGEEQAAELGDAVALAGVRKFSARVKCAMLAWEALEKCLERA